MPPARHVVGKGHQEERVFLRAVSQAQGELELWLVALLSLASAARSVLKREIGPVSKADFAGGVRSSAAANSPCANAALLVMMNACINCVTYLRLFSYSWWLCPLWLTDPFCRNPTLSYTQRLEDRIKDLEDQLAKATAATPPAAASDSKSPASSHSSPSAQQDPRQQIDDSIARSFRGLKIDDKGGITYHGTTSFFNLPSDHSSAAVAVDLHASATEVETQRRERLVSNAWQQRVLEEHSGIPVRVMIWCACYLIALVLMIFLFAGTVPNTSQCPLVLDTAPLQLHLPTCLYSYAPL